MSRPHCAAVVGDPVAHSLSPVLHRAAYRELGLDDHRYEAIEVAQGELPALVANLGPEWLGLSVTMPHKKALLALADVVEPLAATVGAANTLLLQGSGTARVLVAANTDVYGVARALAEARDGVAPNDSSHPQEAAASARPARAVILGAGGTAAAALAGLAELGVTDPVVCVRSQARALDLLQAAHRMGLDVTVRRWDRAAQEIGAADLVVQTAPAGAADGIAAELANLVGQGGLRPRQTLLEAIYHPWPTALARVWTDGGGAVAPGWSMLLHQGAEQVRLMTGRPAPVAAMRAALLAALEPAAH